MSHHDLFRLDPVPGYVHGRTVLLGGAAHVQMPDLRQACTRPLRTPSSWPRRWPATQTRGRLARYDALRRPRTQAMACAAQWQRRLSDRYVGAMMAVARVVPPAPWRRQVTRWTDWIPPQLAPARSEPHL